MAHGINVLCVLLRVDVGKLTFFLQMVNAPAFVCVFFGCEGSP